MEAKMEERLFNGKAKYVGDEAWKWTEDCTTSIGYSLTKGKVYTFERGRFTDDTGRISKVRFYGSELRPNGFKIIEGE